MTKKPDKAGLAKLLTLIENRPSAVASRLAKMGGRHAKRIGITGPPGSGKSMLVDRLISEYRKKNRRVAVLAVDPSSPVSGGAFLGDRVRMQRHGRDANVFVRSMAQRDGAGGIPHALPEAIHAVEAHGFDVVLVETVGTGQADVALCDHCDAIVLLIPPDSMDKMQAMKSGILEMADVLVVSKADLPGVRAVGKALREVLSLQKKHLPVMSVSALRQSGLRELIQTLDHVGKHRAAKPVSGLPTGLDHVAIAVRRIEDHLPLYRDTLGMQHEGTFAFARYGVRIASMRLSHARIELIEPAGPKSALKKFLAKRGEGLHHVAFRVADLNRCVRDLGKNMEWIDKKPRRGLHGSKICFLHPSCTGGVLLEFVQ